MPLPIHGIALSCKESKAAYILLSSVLVLTYALYSQAFNSPWFFDDAPSLSALLSVQDTWTAWEYIWSGIASELGRPLSNLAFLVNVNDWPENPSGFRRVNTLLHLFNGCLLFFLGMQSARLVPATRHKATIFAALLASLWLLQPLQFSATLMPVQRMTILSGSFTLAGLLIYVNGRERLIGERWRSGLIICSIGLIFGAGIGIFAKENAALLPFFVMATEFTIFRRLQNMVPVRLWNMWIFVFFILPAILLLGIIIYRWGGMEATYAMRNFDMLQRLASELVITWDYVRQTFIPISSELGPFHDDVSIHNPWSVPPLLAGVAWLVALGIAIATRKKTSLPMFALVWFWSGHLIESTVFPLELYFEHRNYISIIGPLAVLIGFSISHRSTLFIPWLLLTVFSFSLWRVTSFWSEPIMAGEIMTIYHPYSPRAAQFLAIEYYRHGDKSSAYKVIDQAVGRMPFASDLQATRLQLACQRQDADAVQTALDQIIRVAPQMETSFAVGDALYKILNRIKNDECDGMNFEKFISLTAVLSASSKIASNQLLMHHIHHMRSDVYQLTSRHDLALKELVLAYQAGINPETAMMIASMKLNQGDTSGALNFLDKSMQEMPLGVLKRKDNWRSEVIKLRSYICETQKNLCAQ